MKKPYISKIKSVGEFNCFYVDGTYIRKNINEEFTNFGQHHRFKFIPKKEFWIDNERVKGDTDFYISHLIVEYSLMEKGSSFKKAVVKADKVETNERKKSKYFLKNKKVLIKRPLEKIHKKLWKKYSQGEIKVWIVDGELVRDLYFVDFTEGGHDNVYDFVPKNEVWIDNDLFLKDRKFVLLHEVHERNLMATGMKYHPAHHSSSLIEQHCRNKVKDVDKYLEKEFKKSIIKK